MRHWTFDNIQTLLVAAALFLALPGSLWVGAQEGPPWTYTENKTPDGLAFNVAALTIPKRGPRTVLRFSFQTKSQCEPTVGLAHFMFGNAYGKYHDTARAPEEWAVQVDEHPPEQRRPASVVYSNSFEIVLPVSRALVSDAKSGHVLRMWQTGVGGVQPPPPSQRTHVEYSLEGSAKPLERAEAACAEAMRR
jgi:hypothetical protein